MVGYKILKLGEFSNNGYVIYACNDRKLSQ
jgi:hypothetical protein